MLAQPHSTTAGLHSRGESAHPTARLALHTVLAPIPCISLWIADDRVSCRVFPLFLLFFLDMRADKKETHCVGGLHSGLCCIVPSHQCKGPYCAGSPRGIFMLSGSNHNRSGSATVRAGKQTFLASSVTLPSPGYTSCR